MVPFSIKPVAEKSRLNLYVVELYIYILYILLVVLHLGIANVDNIFRFFDDIH